MYASLHPCIMHTDILFYFSLHIVITMCSIFFVIIVVVKIVNCWIEHPVRNLNKTFSYLSSLDVVEGARVVVPFNNRKLVGFVDEVIETDKSQDELEKEYGYKLKEIIEVIDEESIINNELRDLAFWMEENTLSTVISCFQAMLPSAIKPKSNKQKAVQEKWIEINDIEVDLTPKQLEAFLYAKDNIPLKYSDFRKLYPNQARLLIEKGIISLISKDREAIDDNYVLSTIKPTLTKRQEEVINEIKDSDDDIFLIRGVTGSGKTEVYLRLAEDALMNKEQVLILVPEIGLTPQMIARVSERFNTGLAIYHSGLSPQEKYEQYQKVKNRKANIVVGTRSAIFLPFDKLGLIVIDEEHDQSYKQDNEPCYHARDIAIYRGKYHNCKVVLGSATPSLESYARGKKGNYHLIEMDMRINETLPEITVVDMKKEMNKNDVVILSNVLSQKIQDRLDKGEQIILLLNRRGFNSVLKCKDCGEAVVCPHCDIAMSYHKNIKRMKCHNCGTELNVPRICPKCHSNSGFANFGFGTQRLEEEILAKFKDCKVIRMDRDTTTKKNSHKEFLERFGNGEADILLGTQMISKGLDFPKVTLVGVINADNGLNRTDFRSCEVTFDLLMQAGGRSGRSDSKGEVVYQVFDPDHYAIKSVIKQDYEAFFNKEMTFRRAGNYPPYTYLISLMFSSKNEAKAESTAIKIKNMLHGEFSVLGVIHLLKMADNYRYRIILKGRDLEGMKASLRELLKSSDIDLSSLKIDVNPMILD